MWRDVHIDIRGHHVIPQSVMAGRQFVCSDIASRAAADEPEVSMVS